MTQPEVFTRVAEQASAVGDPLFDLIIVDESQDISMPQLRFLAALRGNAPNGLFFVGDLGQRIFQTPFSWRSLGVDVRCRSSTLRINYRSSHQIRRQADRLSEMESQGVVAREIGIFVRTAEKLDRAAAAVRSAGPKSGRIGQNMEVTEGHVGIGTMHAAKGLEFRAVAAIPCDDDIIPLKSRLTQIADEADLEDVYNTERHLLYVACTRAKGHLLVTAVVSGSEFLEDLA